MKKILSLVIAAYGLAGCLSTSPLETSDWPLEAVSSDVSPLRTRYDMVRLVNVIVRSPYDVRAMAVLRSDGTVIFDAYNRYAALPSQLLRGPAVDLFKASGLFGDTVGPSSIAPSSLSAEVVVSRLALDCRKADARAACVRLSVRLVDRVKGSVSHAQGEGSADAGSGDYGAAFSTAFSAALRAALAKL